MKTLSFSPEQSEVFTTIHMGFLLGTPREGLVGPAKTRTATKILDKLESIAKPADSYAPGQQRMLTSGGDMLYDLREEGGTLELEETEYEMLKSHVTNCPWATGGARRATAVFDYLDSVG